jgi:hypothetical protein
MGSLTTNEHEDSVNVHDVSQHFPEHLSDKIQAQNRSFSIKFKAMISVTSVTDGYILQPTLISKHKKTLEWLSATMLWKKEVAFFQKLLDQYAARFTSLDDKKMVDHFQNIIIYYRGELLDSIASRLRQHEKNLADMLDSVDESKTVYFKEHDEIMGQLEVLNDQLITYKEELFEFIERVMR